MATIKGQLGYPDATVMLASTGTFVAVVDKDASERVVWKSIPEGEGHLPDRLAALVPTKGADPTARQIARLNYGVFRERGADAAIENLSWGQEHAEAIRTIWTEIAKLDRVDDLARALWTLDHNPNPEAREAALDVLGNFLEHDAAWWALADSLRDPVERVRGTATTAFHSALRRTPRPVDWQPASASVAHVLNGTNLSAVHVLAQALLATEVAPALVGPLTAPGAHALLDYVGAQAEFAHDPARRLLERLTGAAHGRDRTAWAAAVAAAR